MIKKNKYILGLLSFFGSLLVILSFYGAASANTLGFDVASYQDSTPTYMQSLKDKGGSFVLAKLGGSGGGEGTHYKNPKASAQLASASSVGMEIGSYFWGQFGSSQSDAIKMANMAIDDAQRVGLKTGSVIALDYEQGATSDKEANTQAIISFMETIQKANYKAVLYSGASYLKNYINVEEIGSTFGARIWVASYKTMSLQTAPDFRYFPSMNYVGMWQYGSNVYGVDGNVDLTNLMKSGDVKNDVKVTPTAPKTVVSAETIDNSNKYYVVQSGDSWWKIANKLGLEMNQLAKLNGLTINSVIHPSQKLLIKGTLKNDAKPTTVKKTTVTTAVSLPSGVRVQSGYFIPNQRLMVWKNAGSNPTDIYYYKGEVIKYVGYIRNGGYNYVAYKTSAGNWRYVADRRMPSRVALGTFR
ncbi:GH25 family lysozyme [Liquorilactobacillus hordei]|uniref:Lysin n=1 Tax=Liquorilactobacillus hordei DSM 19519 TaxID=1423759 RepID=A0A0R1MWH6_9LACO|nr:GH25 family lysozyme [Liquorilactobacillus hordei]KRL07944.1 Lysin [Liquorilactobacillus hordei DSM 19519]QYH51111.1 LysM peptidoglycan-binding domain-containing protein [Liquorilactobacillus hordei DSM 19519]